MTDFNARTRLKLLAGAAALLAGCGGGSSSSQAPVTVSPPPPPPPPPPAGYVPPHRILRDTYRNRFFVGAAVSSGQLLEAGDSTILKSQFSSITAEYEMKPQFIAPTEGVYNWTATDALVDFAELNNIQIRGHALLWHESTPDYFFEGTNAEIKARLEDYITTVMTRYKGRIRFWDVVNEVITDFDDASDPYRRSNWYNAVGGPEYIDWALQAARAADPTAFLFINDYSTELAPKRARLLEVVQDLKDRDIPLDGVGHQMHLKRESTAASALQAIDDVDNMFQGLINHITELDLSVYDDPGTCYETGTNCDPDVGAVLPANLEGDQAQMYRDLFNGFNARSSVTNVTLWGIKDSDSWLNTNPVARTNYPLLYDRDGNAKPAFRAIVEPGYQI